MTSRRGGRRAGHAKAGRATVGPHFEVVDRFRSFQLIGPRFVAVREELGPGSGRTRSGYSPPAPFVTVQVETSDAGGTVLAGLSAENGDHLLGSHDAVTGEVRLELRTGGVSTVLAHARVRGRVRRMAFVLCENQPTVLVDDRRHGWRPVLTDRHRVAQRLDLRVPATLARFTATWELRGRTTDVLLVQAGLFGMVGLRDLHLVQNSDGTPYLHDDGRMYLTATCAGLGFFQQAHWGVFAFEPEALAAGTGGMLSVEDNGPAARLEHRAQLYFHRDGMLLGDHAGQLVRDGDRWLVAVSSWGDFAPHRGVHVRHTTSTADLLAGVHVLDTERVDLPTANSAWDPGMTRIDGRWHVSYVESPSQQPFEFHPALAVGPQHAATWTAGLEHVGAATDLRQCEGPVLARPDGGDWRLLASDGRARRYPVFDLALRPVGRVDAPYGSNLPHPQVIDLAGGRRMIVTFDGTPFARRRLGYGTHGDVVILRTV